MHSFQSSASNSSSTSMSTPGDFLENVLDLHSNMPTRCNKALKHKNPATVWFFGLLSVLALFLVVQGKVSGGPAASILLLVIAIGITLIKGSTPSQVDKIR